MAEDSSYSTRSFTWWANGLIEKVTDKETEVANAPGNYKAEDFNKLCEVVQKCLQSLVLAQMRFKIPQCRVKDDSDDYKLKETEFRRLVDVQNHCLQRQVKFFGFFLCGEKVLLYNTASDVQEKFPVYLHKWNDHDYRYTVTYQFREPVLVEANNVEITQLPCEPSSKNINEAQNFVPSCNISEHAKFVMDEETREIFCVDSDVYYKKVDDNRYVVVPMPENSLHFVMISDPRMLTFEEDNNVTDVMDVMELGHEEPVKTFSEAATQTEFMPFAATVHYGPQESDFA